MNFSRIYSFFFLIALGLFAHATPVESGLAVREEHGNNIMARHYPEHPCHCPQDLLDVCVDLKVQILAISWTNPPSGPCGQVVVALNAAVDLIAGITLDIPCVLADILAIVLILVDIILAIVTGLLTYPFGSIPSLCATIDVALAAFLRACFVLCPELLGQLILSVALLAEVLILRLLGFVATLGILGL